MTFDQATRRQHTAAQPNVSTWVTANAGSGKTRVLTDRVARLLLDGVSPQNVLCLTYTKAAASEMQNRLFQRLGEWAMLPDAKLQESLKKLGETRLLEPAELAQARTLFARAIETPGGLKIQTIHAFCSALLRRFPLEAGVNPNFSELDDRTGQLMRAAIVEDMAQGDNLLEVEGIAQHVTDSDFASLIDNILNNKAAFSQDVSKQVILRLLGQPEDLSEDRLLETVFGPTDQALLNDLVVAMQSGSKTDVTNADKVQLAGFGSLAALAKLEDVFLTGATAKVPFSAKIGSVPTKGTAKTIPHLMPQLEALMLRIEDARPKRLALGIVQPSLDLHAFAQAFLTRYEAEKSHRGLLDFDDLIEKARALLSDSDMAGWVLYKLDGQIDHILVDEAQDTSPGQWDVIRKIAEDFVSGKGAREDISRTIFVVGDRKQSIYSFQGADPVAFDEMRQAFADRLTAIGAPFQSQSLDHSFRSASSILRVVDTVCGESLGNSLGDNSHHIPFHGNLPGRVDLWPLVPEAENQETADWSDPVDLPSEDHHHAVLSNHIAAHIKQMLDTGATIPLPDGSVRPIEARDVLILVQRRSGIFPHIIRACKQARLPIAGSDKLKVGAELAVRDLAALLSFLATPDDDLALASVLRSPLFGWDEQMLFSVAHHRPEGMGLWPHLRGLEQDHSADLAVLNDLRGQVDFLRPYDLLERVLTRHGGRRKIVSRLGKEAEDGIDALLSQAMTYESQSVPSLTGFLAWLQTDELEIKRQVDSMSNQIRVMSVHGAKGLEAPIVILPDTIRRPRPNRDSVLQVDGLALHKPAQNQLPPKMRDALDREADADKRETMRLLYVAMTRAEKWLIVAGAGKRTSTGTNWHGLIAQALPHAGAIDIETPAGPGLRVENGDWPQNASPSQPGASPTLIDVPDYMRQPAPDPVPARQMISPSDLGGAKALPGEGRDEDTAKAYGTLVHSVLERWQTGSSVEHLVQHANASLAMPSAICDEAAAEVASVLSKPALARLFERDTLAEVAVNAPFKEAVIAGTIDRLVISDSEITIVDFKTNRMVPKDADQVPLGIVNQMATYAWALQNMYPNHQIFCDILWTATAHLMRLPHEIVRQAQQDLAYLDV